MNFHRTLIAALCLATLPAAFAATSRPSWVTTQIYNYNHPYAAQNSADLATKMSKMNGSAFYFYRGTDHIFMTDMTTLPASSYTTSTTAYTWLGGDTHLANVGSQRDSSGKSVFTVSDFDEGYLGQYVWDLRRMATSVVLAGRENGISDSNITTAINTLVGAYVDKMSAFKGNDDEKTFQLSSSNTTSYVQTNIKDADGNTRADLLSKYTSVSGSTRKFQNKSDLVAVTSGTYNMIAGAMSSYIASISASKQYAASYYTVKDIHQKLGSGTGSLGRMRYYILIEGPSSSTSDDVILEVKQETTSAVAIALPGQLPSSAYAGNEANRVARTGKAQLINADVLIGSAFINSLPYYFHEKSPFQEDFDYTQLSSSSKLNTAMTYVGQALASAHALADKDYDSTVVPYGIDAEITNAVTSKSGLQAEIVSFAFGYADQVNLDWQSFKSAYSAGTPLY
ncbi:Uncharacterized conserved protein, DUF2252 family [Andreprevotia lacus DSM 23236]|jgi:uncharacterized protein (DUF2252 family)|uniref:Uncharacterized conserved protein, DUF2252 family n=1 Tax=Andreprevotia lacus DSM 23236 TaxID=1121001 RepID=A0A1W1XBB5_9NEIS|nr:DUF2252 family protein [Andreprevotia lacus]SMC21064.1 Uncharacterized conserved protein, DUF2252 family [Andreprevotia lacus DSM 23236]